MDFGFGPHNGVVALPLPRQKPGNGAPIVAVVTDGPEAATVVSCAVRAARGSSRPVVLLVPLRRPAFTTDAAVAKLAYARGANEAQAVASGACRVLAEAEVVAVARVVWYRSWLGRAAARTGSRAVAAAAREAGAGLLIAPELWVEVDAAHGVEASVAPGAPSPRAAVPPALLHRATEEVRAMASTPPVLVVVGSVVAGLGALLPMFAETGLGILLVTPGVALAWLGLVRRQADVRLAGAGGRRVLTEPGPHPARADPRGTTRSATTHLMRDRERPDARPAHVPTACSPTKEER